MSNYTATARGIAALIVNARARLASRRGWRDEVRAPLARRFDLELLFPRDPEESAEVARESAQKGADVVIAVGGDGTINSVVRGLAGSDVPLGILPLGAANDLARELGIPRDPARAAERIVAGRTRRVDLATANGVPFCTVGGLVLVAHTTLLVAWLKRTAPTLRRAADALGGGVYRLAATANLLGRPRLSEPLRIEYRDADDGAHRSIETEAHALFVTNHRTLGGGLVLPVDASAEDGVFELCLVPRRSRISLTANFARLSAGRPLAPGVLTVARATHAVVRTGRDEPFVADGDVLAVGREFELAVRADALTVIA